MAVNASTNDPSGATLVNDGADTDQDTVDRITGAGGATAPPEWYETTDGGRVRTSSINRVGIA